MENKPEQTNVNLNIDEGSASFFAHEFSVEINPTQATLDFKNVSSRTDQRSLSGKKHFKMVHNVISVEPLLLKEMSRILNEIIKKYEEKLGEIKKSEAMLKAEKELQKDVESIHKSQQKSSNKKADYLG